MQFVVGVFVAMIFTAMMIGAMRWRKHIVEITRAEFMELEDSYTYIIDGMEWGPEVVSLVLNCGPEVEGFTSADLAGENFMVTFTSRYRDGARPYQTETRDVVRPVVLAHFCDIDGNVLSTSEGCTHLLLKFDSSKFVEAFSPYYFVSTDGTKFRGEPDAEPRAGNGTAEKISTVEDVDSDSVDSGNSSDVLNTDANIILNANSILIEENCEARWKEVFSCSVSHNKLINKVNVSNDPFYTKEALEKMKDMGLEKMNWLSGLGADRAER